MTSAHGDLCITISSYPGHRPCFHVYYIYSIYCYERKTILIGIACNHSLEYILHTLALSISELHSRLDIEIRALVSDHLPLRVISPPERRSSAWIGGAVVSSLSSFDDTLISRQEYEEFGPGIVHRKCRNL